MKLKYTMSFVIIFTAILMFPVGVFAALVGTGSLDTSSSGPNQHMTFPNTNGYFRADYDADYTVDGFFPSPGLVDVYCVESMPGSTSALTYEFWTIDNSLPLLDPSDANRYIEATWLAHWGLSQSGDQDKNKAIAQIAIWEVLLESSGITYDLGLGNVRASGGNKAAAQTLLDGAFNLALGDATWGDHASDWLLAVNPTGLDPIDALLDYQNYLVPSPAAAPIPSTVFMLGSGLLGLAGIRRKFRR